MKKTAFNLIAILAVSSSLICGCAPKDKGPVDDDPIPMEFEKNDDYVYENIPNDNRSAGYEIFVRSYYDSDGDGVGDLNGVKAKIPYLADLGIKTVWLMPIFPSSTYHGYDVTNYYEVNSQYGTLDDFDALVAEANKYNMDIMLDMVFNHCSKRHQWFKDAKQDFDNNNTSPDSKKDWFNFNSDGSYECGFGSDMPDFNLDCEAVRNELEKITEFWINHGCKGFRLDAVLYYYRDNVSKNAQFLNWLRDTAHKYDPNFYFVGECWTTDASLNSYFASECDSFFRFSTAMGGDYCFVNYMKGRGSAKTLLNVIEKNEKYAKSRNPNSYSSYFLSNHDQDRVGHNFNEMQNKCAASFYMLLPGTPYMYYGEEIGLLGKRITSPDDYSDARRRLPMIWSKDNKTGQCKFPEANRPDLNHNAQVELGADDRLQEKFSVLKHYKKVLNIRNKYNVFKHGTFENLYSSLNVTENYIYAFKVSLGDDYVIVVHNAGTKNIKVTAPGTEIIEQINTSHRIPTLNGEELTLGAYSTVLMK